MANFDNDFIDDFNINDIDDARNINAILNDQHATRYGVIKNLIVILVIISIGIGVFWGSFLLGKKVFTSSIPQTKIVEQKMDTEEELVQFSMPEENILFQIESLEKQEKEEKEKLEKLAVVTKPAKVAKKPEPKSVPKIVKQEIKQAVKPQTKLKKQVMYKITAGSYSDYDNATALKKKLNSKGFDVYIAPVKVKGATMFRVQIGAFDTEDQAKMMIKRAKAKGIDAFYIQE